MFSFKTNLDIIGINPFVFVPPAILAGIFNIAGKEKGHIPVRGTVNGLPYTQTLVRYKGEWRLYINTVMLKNSPQRIGESLNIVIGFDETDRTLIPHPKLTAALGNNPEAQRAFDRLTPSVRKEIIRYISYLKREDSIDKNVDKAVAFLLGKASFVGRKMPE